MKFKILVAAVLFSVAAHGQIYKVVDSKTGAVSFTNFKPSASRGLRVETLFKQSAGSQVDRQGANHNAQSDGTADAAAQSSADRAFAGHLSDVQVSGVGRVKRLLAQDNDGSRHQKFILELPSGLTLLVAHNIDLAAEMVGLSVGDVVAFSGEYVWNEQGGVLHWTHRDPNGSHVAGYLRQVGRGGR